MSDTGGFLPPPTPPAPAETPKPSWWRRKVIGMPVWVAIVGGVLVLGLIGSIINPKKDENSSSTAGATTGEADDTSTTVERTTTTDAGTGGDQVGDCVGQETLRDHDSDGWGTCEAPETTTTTSSIIQSGVWIVGTEIQPGMYRVGSYWARLDANQEIIDNDLSSDCPTLLIVQPTDAYIDITGGALPIEDSLAIDPVGEGCTDGTFLVGLDIQPGRYRVQPAGSSAYWAKYDATLDLVDNDLSEGPLILDIRPGDFAISISGTLEPIP